MKFIKFLVVCLISISISSCASEMERDAIKMAESAIRLQQIRERMNMNDRSNIHGKPISRQEYQSYAQEHIELFNQMSEKYNSIGQWDEFSQLVSDKIRESEQE